MLAVGSIHAGGRTVMISCTVEMVCTSKKRCGLASRVHGGERFRWRVDLCLVLHSKTPRRANVIVLSRCHSEEGVFLLWGSALPPCLCAFCQYSSGQCFFCS